jgi:hypothetical protein
VADYVVAALESGFPVEAGEDDGGGAEFGGGEDVGGRVVAYWFGSRFGFVLGVR